MTCTFFGHRIVPKEIEPTLRSTLIDLIINHNVKLFYVGNHGGFDAMVRRVLKSLSAEYPIKYPESEEATIPTTTPTPSSRKVSKPRRNASRFRTETDG